MDEVMFSSKKDDWGTPWELYNELDEEFSFDIDVCADADNAKHPVYYSKYYDAFKHEWHGTCWMNPPYGRKIGRWVQKAYEESLTGRCRVVALLPARTDTKWFHEFIYGKAEIRFLKGRVKFQGAKHGAPFPSMICVFGGQP